MIRSEHMNIMRRRLIAAAAVTLVAGCASTPSEPQTLREAQADFGSYKTFGWHRPAGGEGSGQPTSIVDGYIRTAIRDELTRKGYVEAAPGMPADITVDYEAASAETLKEKPFRIGVGVGSYGSSGGGSVGVGSSSTKKVREGSLVVHVIDPTRETEIWRGSIERELDKGGVQPAQVKAAVTELLQDFPARSAQP
jgi:hypothetical protein